MTLGIAEVRGIVERVFARQDVLEACGRRDLGRIILVLGRHGLTQGRISELTGISQGRLSEWAGRKRKPRASSVFEAFADGLGVPAAARQALGLADDGNPAGAGPGRARPAGGGAGPPALTAAAGAPLPFPARAPVEGLGDLLGRETVRARLGEVVAAVAAERRRRDAGLVVRRPVWKNLVFTGGPGAGKSRAALAVGQVYRQLGVLATGHVIEAAAADLVGAGPGETGKLVAEAVRPAGGGVLVINDADDWRRLPDQGRQVLRRLYEQLGEYRAERRDELAVILAGPAGPLQALLAGSPALAARFRAVVDFPPYTPAQLAEIFADLVGEAGLALAPAAAARAAAVLARAEGDRGRGNARLAVRLLNLATANQALRVAAGSGPGREPAALRALTEADIPAELGSDGVLADEYWPGQYL
jgi:transcriptional regulator with XRE-family HTH domain